MLSKNNALPLYARSTTFRFEMMLKRQRSLFYFITEMCLRYMRSVNLCTMCRRRKAGVRCVVHVKMWLDIVKQPKKNTNKYLSLFNVIFLGRHHSNGCESTKYCNRIVAFYAQSKCVCLCVYSSVHTVKQNAKFFGPIPLICSCLFGLKQDWNLIYKLMLYILSNCSLMLLLFYFISWYYTQLLLG